MNIMIERENKSSERLFPPVGPDFYSTDKQTGLNSKQQAALKILALANKKYTAWERLFGWKLDNPGKIGRLLLLHKNAVAAEKEKQLRQADFFWQKFYETLESMYHEESIWQELAKFTFDDAEDDPLVLRQTLIEEVFLDTHCAFYNGRIMEGKALSPVDRAFFHTNYIKKLVELAVIPQKAFQ